MSWTFYLALKQLFPTGRKISFFAAMSVLGVALGVAVLLCVSSVMNGFGREIRNKLIEVNGHVQIYSGGIIEEPEALAARLAADPSVEGATPLSEGVVMILCENRPAFPAIRGLDLKTAVSVMPLESYLLAGDLEDIDDDSILLSSQLAASIGAQVGAEVDIFTPLMLDRLKQDEVLLPRSVRVAGIFETGWSTIDANTAVCTLRLMRELYGLGGGAHKVALRLKDVGDDMAKTAQAAERLNAELPAPLSASSWMDGNREFLNVLLLEKTVMVFIMFLILIVAAFSIMTSLHTSVVRKTREIGLLGALGARPRQSACVFCWQGLIIGTFGSALGVGLAFLLLHYRDGIVGLFIDRATMARYYQFLSFPVDYAVSDFVKVVLFAVLAATLAGLLPAWRAARIKPSETLRHE